MLTQWWLPALALGLDLLWADPRFLPHPVQGIAFLAAKLETPARRMGHPILAGALALGALLAAIGGLSALLLYLPVFWATLSAVYLSWSGLALGGLLREGYAALAAIEAAEQPGADAGRLDKARGAVQMLVSRDAGNMNIQDLRRSLAESISENFNDAFVAPYFWLCLGGPVGLWVYKTASTMDSLWGYKTERWLYLGRACARLDDILAYIPARICVLLMLAVACFESPPRRASFYAIAKQARRCASPNAGWPMATAAWLFTGKSGGPTPYAGQMVDKPSLGPEHGQWTGQNILALLAHVRRAGIFGGVLGALLLLSASYLRA